jgi:hypothetical protein
MGSSKEKETGIGYAKKLGVQFSWEKKQLVRKYIIH